MKNAIDIKGVSKTYRDFTLDSLTLSLPEGSIMGLIGENGAGKSTTHKAHNERHTARFRQHRGTGHGQ